MKSESATVKLTVMTPPLLHTLEFVLPDVCDPEPTSWYSLMSIVLYVPLSGSEALNCSATFFQSTSLYRTPIDTICSSLTALRVSSTSWYCFFCCTKA